MVYVIACIYAGVPVRVCASMQMQDVTSGNETREMSHIAVLFLVCLEDAKRWGKLVICRKYMWNGENGREVRMGGS